MYSVLTERDFFKLVQGGCMMTFKGTQFALIATWPFCMLPILTVIRAVAYIFTKSTMIIYHSVLLLQSIFIIKDEKKYVQSKHILQILG